MTLSEYFSPKTRPPIQEGTLFSVQTYGGNTLLCILCQVGPGVFQVIIISKNNANRMCASVDLGTFGGSSRFTAEAMSKLFGDAYPLEEIIIITPQEALEYLTKVWA